MKGFQFGGISAGIKNNGNKDLGIIFCDRPVPAAALFTRNKVVAAPVIHGREMIQSGLCQAVLVNSGNANCFTGEKGVADTAECAELTAGSLNISSDLVFVSSTGVIGAPLPMERFETGIPKAAKVLSEDNIEDFARAILTTDTKSKIVEKKGGYGDHEFSILGVAKGSGMIRPDMATMLCFICTDAAISAKDLHTALTFANEKSFNRISIDGDTSTNDTLLALASGSCGVKIDGGNAQNKFQELLNEVCFELASLIVKDGEGATKFVQITVKGAKTQTDAFKSSEAIAHSNLVKTAIFGEDPNWGRITAAAGRSGADVVPEKMDLFFDEVPLVLKGQWLGLEAEKNAARVMKNKQIHITLDLNLGNASDFFLFCDFSREYVTINADYRS